MTHNNIVIVVVQLKIEIIGEKILRPFTRGGTSTQQPFSTLLTYPDISDTRSVAAGWVSRVFQPWAKQILIKLFIL